MVLTAGCRMQGVGGRHEAAVQKQRKGWDVIVAKAPARSGLWCSLRHVR